MVWYGMVWCGMVWFGVVWYGMVWYGMVWYGIVYWQNPTSGLLSMLRSDWLSYYQAICYSFLVAKSVGFLAAKKD